MVKIIDLTPTAAVMQNETVQQSHPKLVWRAVAEGEDIEFVFKVYAKPPLT